MHVKTNVCIGARLVCWCVFAGAAAVRVSRRAVQIRRRRSALCGGGGGDAAAAGGVLWGTGGPSTKRNELTLEYLAFEIDRKAIGAPDRRLFFVEHVSSSFFAIFLFGSHFKAALIDDTPPALPADYLARRRHAQLRPAALSAVRATH
jgi:hypothetical protein